MVCVSISNIAGDIFTVIVLYYNDQDNTEYLIFFEFLNQSVYSVYWYFRQSKRDCDNIIKISGESGEETSFWGYQCTLSLKS